MTNLAPGYMRRLDRLQALPRDTGPPPALESFADRLYAALGPVAWLDDVSGYALAYFAGALGEMFQAVEDLARDTADGPGWSAVVDIERCPDDWLRWLGQFVGVSNGTRAAITDHNGFQRGTVQAIHAAAATNLTGSKTIVIQERLGGDAYALGIYTIDTETPTPAQTLSDILTQKPGGIVLTYAHGPANTYEAVRIGNATYGDVKTKFTTYGRMATGTTGA